MLDRYAERSELAYKTPEVIRKKLPDATHIGTTKSNVQYIVEVDPSERSQTISIRGTANKKNVFQDADLHMVDDPELGIVVHKGFNADTNEVYGEVKPFLEQELPHFHHGSFSRWSNRSHSCAETRKGRL